MSSIVPKKVDRYQILTGKKLGEGQFGEVYIALDTKKNNKKRAIKVVAKQTCQVQTDFVKNDHIKAAFHREVVMNEIVQSVGTVRCVDVLETEHNYYMVMQYCRGGDLKSYLKKNYPQGMPVQKLHQFTIQLLECFSVLAQKGIAHRDIKPDNILIKDNNGVELKLCDFGFAKANEGQMFTTLVGTPAYMSPQILAHHKYSNKCDVWSMGILIYEMMYGIRPFPADVQSLEDLADYFHHHGNNIKFQNLKGQNQILKTQMIQFVKGCLTVSERQRYGWSQIYNHQLFQGRFAGQNKLKIGIIMSALKLSIHTKRIDVEQLFEGYKERRVNCEEFRELMRTLSTEMSEKDIHFLIGLYGKKSPQSDQIKINLNEILGAFKASNIKTRRVDIKITKSTIF